MRDKNVFGMGRAALLGGFLIMASTLAAWAQTAEAAGASSSDAAVTVAVQELKQQVGELRAAVAEMRAEAAQYRQETAELRRELEDLRGQPGAASVEAKSYPNPSRPEPSGTEAAPQTAPAAPLEQRVASLEETTQLLNSKIEDQYQTKVESASKYRVRLSGIALMNLFGNSGTTDNMDIPSLVLGPNQGGNFGATLRQSEVSLEVFGPTLAGAKTSADVQADFAGGFPNTWNGVNSGIFRLQLASARLDWPSTSVVVGQDNLFISPLSPTSFASLAVPAFNYAGNLWAWTPQVRV
ncbi:MAG TPA: hypothetical protein VMH03_15650, partial [Terriglobales bacterium]|nr:hypothetical protein [Terriglobales bacterium]